MGTAFRDLELRLTEAALAAELMPPEEAARLFAEAATVIKTFDLRSKNFGQWRIAWPNTWRVHRPPGRINSRRV